jgi:hypothetical protein
MDKPVAWWHDRGDVVDLNVSCHGTPLYFSPPNKEWVGLTDDEIREIDCIPDYPEWQDIKDFTRALEAKLKEKNT